MKKKDTPATDERGTDPHACRGHCQSQAGNAPHGHRHAPRTFPVPPEPVATYQNCRIGGIILAAGRASRMGRCKAVLPLDDSTGTTVLQAAAETLQGGCNGPVIVVTGFHDTAVRAEAERLGLCTVHNPEADSGMFSSVRTGLQALLHTEGQGVNAMFMLPVDIPLIRPATCALLAEAFAEHNAAVVYPTFCAERGHPPLIRADVAARAVVHSGEGGLRWVLEAAERSGLPVRDVPVADAGILADMDTPDAYEAGRARFATRNLPTEREISALLDVAETPDHVRAHGRCVAAVAVCMAKALNKMHPENGAAQLDCERIHAAGALHDICKGARHHEQAGGLFLTRHGFDAVGGIVAAHRDIDPGTVARLAERELVMLADKFVRGTTLVPIAERFDERLREWAHDAEAVRDIGGRKDRALALCAMLEAEAGEDILALLLRSNTCPAT